MPEPKPKRAKLGPMTCDVCQMNIPGNAWEDHLLGKHHKKELKKQKEQMYCKLCELSIPLDTWNAHTETKRHQKELRKHQIAPPPYDSPPNVFITPHDTFIAPPSWMSDIVFIVRSQYKSWPGKAI